MAIVIVNEMHGGSQDLYDRVTAKVMPGDKLPDGCRDHIAGPIEGGWRVITVWESEGQFDRFRNDTLIPALQEAGAGDSVAPQITANPVHKHVTT
jgi:hypothetical protein